MSKQLPRLIALALLFPTLAQADIIHVPKDHPTIQGAINVASKGDEIIVAPGSYHEVLNFFGQAITLRSSEAPTVSIIDADGQGSVVTCASGEDSDTIIRGFTLTGGSAPCGGGMRNLESSPTVTDCIFENNEAGIGGAMCNDHSSPDVVGVLFTNNIATSNPGGGAIYNLSGAPVIADCVFSANQSDYDGGAILNHESDPEIHNCSFTGNSAATNGGGISNLSSSPIITRCRFVGNVASAPAFGNTGGAIHNFSGDVTIDRCSFIMNEATVGGAINSISGSDNSVSIANSEFAQNIAHEKGGALRNACNKTVTIVNCTFVGNVAEDVGGGMDNTCADEVVVTNSVFWLNQPNQVFSGDSPTTVNHSDIHGGWDGPGEGNINAYPMFVDMKGGNLRLMGDSPCIDKGDNAAVPEDVEADLDGNPRIIDGDDKGNAIVDMGAYEYQGYPVCAQDLNGDGAVGPVDLAMLLGGWGFNPGHPADLDHDGVVGPSDLAMLLGAWGPCS